MKKTLNEKDILNDAEKLGNCLANEIPFKNRLEAYKNLKVLMHGGDIQTFFIKKGYEEKKKSIFNRENAVKEILKKGNNFLYSSKDERKFFAFAIFNWLIRRYDFFSACNLLSWLKKPDKEKNQYVFPWTWIIGLILLNIALVVHVGIQPNYTGMEQISLILFACILIGFLVWTLFLVGWSRLFIALRLLIPRLAVTILVGHLFIQSANDLKVVVSNISPWKTVIFSILVIILYLRLEMANNLKPQPRERSIWFRIFQLMLIGIFWAMSLGLVMRLVLKGSYSDLGSYLSLSSVALVLGIILEVAWQDKPISEPI